MPSIPPPADDRRDAARAIVRTFEPEPPAGLPYGFNLEQPQVGVYAIAVLAYLARIDADTRVTVGELAGFFCQSDLSEMAAAVTEIIRAGYAEDR